MLSILKETFKKKVLEILDEMKKIIKYSNYGVRIRDGFVITIIGRPNVGKSSLINYLSNRKASIVTDEAGTTRDIIEVVMDFEGFPVILNDTAGIRRAGSEVEKIGIKLALEKAKSSDLVLVLSDNEDFSFPELISKCKKIFVRTKSDLGVSSKKNIFNISVKEDIGINILTNTIVKYLKSLVPKEDL